MQIGDAIDWMNANQGAVMVLLTAVYVLATVLILAQARRSAHLQLRSLEQASRLERDRLRPRLLVKFDFLPGSFSRLDQMMFTHITLTNVGATAAINVLVRVQPELIGTPGEEKRERRPAIINQTIAFIAPEQRVRDLIDEAKSFFERYREARFAIEATYSDALGEHYAERYEIDLGPLAATSEISDPMKGLITSLTEVAKRAESHLSSLAQHLAAPDRSNLMVPMAPADATVSQRHEELLERLHAIEAGRKPEAASGFFAYHVLNSPHAQIKSVGTEHELEGDMADLEYLIRAGRLHGRYEGSSLRFWVVCVPPHSHLARSR